MDCSRHQPFACQCPDSEGSRPTASRLKSGALVFAAGFFGILSLEDKDAWALHAGNAVPLSKNDRCGQAICKTRQGPGSPGCAVRGINPIHLDPENTLDGIGGNAGLDGK